MVRTLPPSEAQVIALHYYEDYSIVQIAVALGRAPGTIKAQLHHGRRRLARLLDLDRPREVDMNLDDQLPGVRMNLDERLRAAGNALREGSATQVDAAGGLREIVYAGRLARLRTRLVALPGELVAPAPAGPPRRTRDWRSPSTWCWCWCSGWSSGSWSAPGQERRRPPTRAHRPAPSSPPAPPRGTPPGPWSRSRKPVSTPPTWPTR